MCEDGSQKLAVNETEDEQRTKHGSKWRREGKSSKKVKRVAAYGFIARSQWELSDLCPVKKHVKCYITPNKAQF